MHLIHRGLKASTVYAYRHRNIRELRGPATQYECVRCTEYGVGRQAKFWSTIHGADGFDYWADYVPLCSSCHRLYDMTDELRAQFSQYASNRSDVHNANIGEAKRGRPLSEQHRARIRAGIRLHLPSQSAEVRRKRSESLKGYPYQGKKCEPGCTCGRHHRG
jgi:hypothetical protein